MDSRKLPLLVLLASVNVGSNSIHAREYILVPAEDGDLSATGGDFDSIQMALDASQDGDIITLQPGTYLANLRVPRKLITLRGDPRSSFDEIIIDGSGCNAEVNNGWCSVLVFDWEEDGGELLDGEESHLENLTVTGGLGSSYYSASDPTDHKYGGGLWMNEANPHLTRVGIKGNSADHGGGIRLIDSSPIIHQVKITRNLASGYGGGISMSYSFSSLIEVLIEGNVSEINGGGLALTNSSPLMSQVTLSGNMTRSEGGGVRLYQSFPTFHNTIIAFNHSSTGQNIFGFGEGNDPIFDQLLTWLPNGNSGIHGLEPRDGSMVGDPLFYNDPLHGSQHTMDVHLRLGSAAQNAGAQTKWDGAAFVPYTNATGRAPDLGFYGGESMSSLDSDGDGAPDDWERSQGLDSLTEGDADEDGLSDGEEFNNGTDPWNTDSDLDGISDQEELRHASDPRDYSDPGPDPAEPRVVRVPGDFSDLQMAIDSVGSGATIRVSTGVYGGDIRVLWKGLKIESTAGAGQTVFDGQGFNQVVILRGTPDEFYLKGFTITGGNGRYGGGLILLESQGNLEDLIIEGNSARFGGGVYISSSSPSMSRLNIDGNTATEGGGGMEIVNSSPSLSRVIFSGNIASYGGGLGIKASSPRLTQLIIEGNSAVDYLPEGSALMEIGGGMMIWDSYPILSQVTVVGNEAYLGGGMFLLDSGPILHNSILAFNPAYDASSIFKSGGTAVLDHVITWTGDGSNSGVIGMPISDSTLVSDPHFLNLENRDLRLLYPDSPAINAGSASCPNPDTDSVDIPCTDPDGSLPDMGAFGGPGAGGDSDGDGAPAEAWWPEDGSGGIIVATPYLAEIDCDDNADSIYPGAQEWPDDYDNDCDGIVDEGSEPSCSLTPNGGATSGLFLILIAIFSRPKSEDAGILF